MEQLGYPYTEMESHGIYAPVRSLACDYRQPCTFNDEIEISVSVAAFNGARLVLRYEMKKENQVICTATSEHAFLDEKDQILRLKRAVPELSQKIELLCAHNESGEDK